MFKGKYKGKLVRFFYDHKGKFAVWFVYEIKMGENYNFPKILIKKYSN